jgi:signal transduction histidine kinase
VPSILEVVCQSTGMGFAAVARVTADRWIACAVRDNIDFGLAPGGELRIETTICNEIRQSSQAVVISHVAESAEYRHHNTPALYGFQSYISVPIFRRDGVLFGTLCAIDPLPAPLDDPKIIGMFRLFAELIAAQLDADERLADSQASLVNERKIAALREQFIAVLGHDLRNPLASIDAGTRILQRGPDAEKALSITMMMQKSVRRMAGLIDNVLDCARGRLGGGFAIERRGALIQPALEQVIAELRLSFPDRTIDTAFSLEEPVNCDPGRIAQLFSNLLGNALNHGSPCSPVKVSGSLHGDMLELSVSNSGDDIPSDTLGRLFEPFSRSDFALHKQGLGLGLYIASEIAVAHGGRMTASSSGGETMFTFVMPLKQPMNL